MELPTIEMPKAEARKAFLEYRRAVRERHSAEDEMIMRGYRALSQGHQVINLLDVMKAAGLDANMMPKLAIARADALEIFVSGRWNGGATFCSRPSWQCRRCPASQHVRLPERSLPVSDKRMDGRAMVPIIPPHLRPQHALSNYHILWEAEWTRTAPRDPALLKHAGGWLYVVLATWDLTPLEQAVLGLTRN